MSKRYEQILHQKHIKGKKAYERYSVLFVTEVLQME